MWVERDRPDEVHAVITWQDDESWLAIAQAELAAVDQSMGTWRRDATCRVFDVIREC